VATTVQFSVVGASTGTVALPLFTQGSHRRLFINQPFFEQLWRGLCRKADEVKVSGTIPGAARSPTNHRSKPETYMPENNTAKKSFEAGTRTAREAMEKGTAAAEQATRRAEQSFETTANGISEFNSKLLAIAQTNMMAGMNFVSELAQVKDPTEAFELWSRHAQSQFQRFSEQSQELATLGQRLASSSTAPLTRGFDQAFKRAP
jgi:hypothetical protein